MELQHFSHQHPLVFNQERSPESENAYCSGCGELVLGSSYNCVACGFHLDKKCAEAPSEISHPFHLNHSFTLLKQHPYKGKCTCDFCHKPCENFVYHCSYGCQLDLHIKCAVLSLNIAEKKIGELQNIARIDPSISTENHPEELKTANCIACWKPLLDSAYLSPHHCGFYLHAKCVDLPVKTNHLFHPEHPLLLQFNSERLPCKICQKTQWQGFVYCCSSCKFVLHIDCAPVPTRIDNPFYHKHPLLLQSIDEGLPCQICQETKFEGYGYCCSTCKFAVHIDCSSPPSIIENKSHHPHPFIFFRRRASFICEACGTSGNLVSYICSTCGIIVHKKCISLPQILKHPWHPDHPIFLTYFLEKDEFDSWDCRICHLEEVDSKYGSYYCSHCNYIVHVNCAIKEYNWYDFDESGSIDENLEENSSALLPYSIVKETKQGEIVVAIQIKHFTHEHNLVLSNDIKDDKYCDGCVLPILSSHYYCSECDYFLHKSCVEFPRKKHFWFHNHRQLHPLSSNKIFRCTQCHYETNGFDYTCDRCKWSFCIRCASLSNTPKCEGHEHLLPWTKNYEGLCNACGIDLKGAYRCKRCNFNLNLNCMRLPLTARRHKFDEHPLQLSYHDNSDYSECYYCDICEQKRNPNHWFYHCWTCNNSAHPACVLGEYSFIKLGKTIIDKRHHPHRLTFVQKVHLYPECHICGKPCLDLALECENNTGTGCSYIVHWKCIKRGLLKVA